jgi:N4-gp56 family major capsid protein
MAITSFIPEIWSAALLESLKKSLIYAAPGVVNRDYEGDISSAGDTVRITSISRPTIGTYVPNVTTITPQAIVDADRSLVIDQVKYWAFEVDDVDARQAAGNVLPAATAEAAYGLADVIDQFVAAKYTEAATANTVPNATVTDATNTTWTNVYDHCLVPLKIALDIASVPSAQRYVIMHPTVQGYLLRDNRFIRVNEAGDSGEALRNGMVGRAAGFDVLMSVNAPVPSANNYIVQAGVPQAITFAEQINKTEAYRPQSSFADAIKGLALYGAKTIRPDALAVCTVVVS